MPDRDKVIKAIKICYTLGHNCTECPLFSEDDCNDKLMHDALELLKAQEPVRVGKKIKAGDVVLDFYTCGHCKNAIRKPWRYCPFCGRKVLWDGDT